MLRLKLKDFMDKRNISADDLERAVSTVGGSDQGISERYLRYLIDNTEPLVANSPQRKPSLTMLGAIIDGLEYLSGEVVEISDVLEHGSLASKDRRKQRVAEPPKHVAFIVDGNRRWARAHDLTFYKAYKIAGGNLVQNVCTTADYGVKNVTAFLFSNENWKRDPDEVEAVFTSFSEILYQYTPTFVENGIRTHAIGDLAELPNTVQDALDYTTNETGLNTECRCNFVMAFNYGGRWDVLSAIKQIVDRGSTDDLTDETVNQVLSTASFGDPDLLIRTGGTRRLSNFMLWQLAYTELYFSELLWPDFTPGRLLEALKSFGSCERRFGS